MDLQEIRKQLDSIDAGFVRLFEKRMKLCADVAEFKIRTGKAVYDPKREQEKIAAVRSMAGRVYERGGGRAVSADDDSQPPVSVSPDGAGTERL